jgi:hypothetical protein
MSLDFKIIEVQNLVKKNIDRLPQLRLFLITYEQWLRVYNGHIEKHEEFVELSFIRNLKPKRGEILNFGSKLEFLVNELIQAKLLGLFSSQAYEFDDLLRYVNFNSRIQILKKWGVITNHQKKDIKKVMEVRNQLAHKWDEKEVLYGQEKNIIENIDEFRKAAEKVWRNLVEIYMKEEDKRIGTLISQLDDPNTVNLWAEITKVKESSGEVSDEQANDSKYFPSI